MVRAVFCALADIAAVLDVLHPLVRACDELEMDGAGNRCALAGFPVSWEIRNPMVRACVLDRSSGVNHVYFVRFHWRCHYREDARFDGMSICS